MDCSICLSTIVNKITTICNHTFCKDCISKWCSINKSCPMCRTPINIVPTQLPKIKSKIYNEDGSLIHRRQNYLDRYMGGELELEDVIGL